MRGAERKEEGGKRGGGEAIGGCGGWVGERQEGNGEGGWPRPQDTGWGLLGRPAGGVAGRGEAWAGGAETLRGQEHKAGQEGSETLRGRRRRRGWKVVG